MHTQVQHLIRLSRLPCHQDISSKFCNNFYEFQVKFDFHEKQIMAGDLDEMSKLICFKAAKLKNVFCKFKMAIQIFMYFWSQDFHMCITMRHI